jgi:hypothetical protein
LNVVAAIALAREIGAEKAVVTVACDTGLKYVSGEPLWGVEARLHELEEFLFLRPRHDLLRVCNDV